MWTIDPKIPIGLWWALAALSVLIIVGYFLRRDWTLSVGRQWLIGMLWSLGLLGPLLIALNPILVETIPPIPGSPVLGVLVDGTMSMATADLDEGRQTRWQAALEAAKSVVPEVSLLANDSKVEVRSQVFDDQLHALQETQRDRWPRGNRSDVANALRTEVRKSNLAGHAVLLISDGAHNAGSMESLLAVAQEAKAMDVPIYTITLGGSVNSKNLSLAARSPKMIAFPNNPIIIRIRLGNSGFHGDSAKLTLFRDDVPIQNKLVKLGTDSNQEVIFNLEKIPKDVLQRYQIVAEPLEGEASDADNRTSVTVQRLDNPIGVLVLEGKPYWDSKFLIRNLSGDPMVQLTSLIQIAQNRFLMKKNPRHLGLDPTSETSEQTGSQSTVDEDSNPVADSDWRIEQNLKSPLEDAALLRQYRLIVLGRDAEVFLTDTGLQNLRQWILQEGGCLLCSRGAPTNQTMAKLADILPVRWSSGIESRFRSKISQYGHDSAIFDSIVDDGGDPLTNLPSLEMNAIPKSRLGLPQVLVQSTRDQDGQVIPIVSNQPYGSGQTIVVEGSGMWRWAFLPPQHAASDNIYPALWQSLVQWVISQQDFLPGQDVAIRSDRPTFLSGDPAGATVIVRPNSELQGEIESNDLQVLLDGGRMTLPKRFPLIRFDDDKNVFRVDFGTLDVGYYEARVVSGQTDTTLAETSMEVRDPWFERLEVDARPDVLKRVSQISGGKVLEPSEAATVIETFQKKLEAARPSKFTKRSIWDKPTILLLVLATWVTLWIVRRQSGLV